MEKLKAVINKYWKVYVAALIIAAVCDLIGTLKFNIGIGTLTLFPMVFATIFGGLLGPDAFKLFKTEESKLGGSLVLVALAPFMAKMGISAGGNLAKLVAVGSGYRPFDDNYSDIVSIPIKNGLRLEIGWIVRQKYTLSDTASRFVDLLMQVESVVL